VAFRSGNTQGCSSVVIVRIHLPSHYVQALKQEEVVIEGCIEESEMLITYTAFREVFVRLLNSQLGSVFYEEIAQLWALSVI
jgi:hypothetical protein